MKKLIALLLGSVFLLSTTACSNVARTTPDAPETTNETAETPGVNEAQEVHEDGTSEVRRRQLEADIRAREQRNNMTAGDAEQADSYLASEVRSKLEANLPASQLTVESKNGFVTIAATVPSQPQYDRIIPLAKEIKGVEGVAVQVNVVEAQPEADNNQQQQ